MALKELDLHIHNRPGMRNANANTLSRTLSESAAVTEPSEPPVVWQPFDQGGFSKGQGRLSEEEEAVSVP